MNTTPEQRRELRDRANACVRARCYLSVDPSTVIALLDDIEALERERDALSREVEEWRNTLKNRA